MMTKRSLVLVIGALALVGSSTACEALDTSPERPSVEMPLDAAWRTVNQNLQVIFPEWDAAQPFPDEPPSEPEILRGCSTGSNSLADGPPWSVRNQTDVDYLGDPAVRAQVDRGFTALEARGFQPVDYGPKDAPQERKVADDNGFVVVLMVSWRNEDVWTISSFSPCITFPGDEKYSKTR
ncbi:hypothetical protein [Gordonia aurantiaca]|uniref:hypothetical protein n=1 Tax=Gordonia sp. B21 TaxID=3151852 RepID=UPI003264D728